MSNMIKCSCSAVDIINQKMETIPIRKNKIFEKFCKYGSSHNNPLAIHDTKFFAIEPLASRFGL